MKTAKPKTQAKEQTDNRRSERASDGRFLPGNSIGRQFKPGESGNVKGRKDSLTDVLRRRLPAIRDKADGRTNAELLADMLLEEAIEGRNVAAAREIFDRVEGKPKQAIDLTVRKSESEMYEGMIADLIERAATKGIKISRSKAIKYLAKHDARILEVVELASEKLQ